MITWQKCGAVPRRARSQGPKIAVSLNSRLRRTLGSGVIHEKTKKVKLMGQS